MPSLLQRYPVSLETVRRAANRLKREVLAIGPLRRINDRRHETHRRRHAPSLPALSAADAAFVERLDREGALVVPLTSLGLPGTGEMTAAALALVPELKARPRNGDIAVRLPLQRLAEQGGIWRWGIQHRLLDLVENYLGVPVWYHGADIRQEIANGEVSDVRQWHRDAEDYRMFKIILYLNDVPDGAGGPFTYLDRAQTLAACDRLRYVSGFVPDARMEQAVPRSLWRQATGPGLTAAVADTCNVFHRAGAPTARDRFSVTFSFTSRAPAKTYATLGFTPGQLRTLQEGLDERQRSCIPG